MPFKKLSDEELVSLKHEFDQLNSIKEKFDFWTTRIGISYIWMGVSFATNDRGVQNFYIRPKRGSEAEEFNYYLLDEAKFFDFGRNLTESEALIQSLNERLKGVVNPMPILNSEIAKIDAEVEKHKSLTKMPKTDIAVLKLVLASHWLHAYDDYYLKRLEVDYSSDHFSYASIMGVYGGCEMAKYRVFVEKKIEEVVNKQVPLAQEETPLKRQLLILEYTGMLDKLVHLQKKDRDKLLSILLNRSEQSVKQELTNLPKRSRVYKIRTEKNYSFLLDLFNKVGLNEQVEIVKNEIDKLKSEKK